VSYLFDTDIVSNPLKKAPSVQLLRKLAVVPAEEQFTSTITVGEMTYGAQRSDKAAEYLARFANEVWPNLQILPFDFDAAEVYGKLRADLEKQGTPLAEPDVRIAAIALSRGLVLVTGNARHFSRIEALTVENWL
jgi:tRNA(fMet)-specific endonuclease VapC